MKKTYYKKDSELLDIEYDTIYGLITKCINEIRKKRPITHNYKALVRYYPEKGKTKHMTVGFIENKYTLNKLVSYIYHSDFIKKYYYKKTVDEFVTELLIKYVYNKNLTKDQIAEKIIQHFEKIHIWKIIFPLENIKLEIPFLKLGNHKIVTFNKYQKTKWTELINNYYKTSQFSKKQNIAIDMFNRVFNEILKDKICTIIQVKSGDFKSAMNEATKEFQVFLSCLKYLSYTWYSDYNKHRIFIPGQNYCKIAGFIGFSESSGLASRLENKKPFPFVLNKIINNRMHEFALKKISDILKIDDNDRTSFQKNILTSIKIYGDAISDFDQSQAFIKFVTLLEFLLIDGRELKSHNLAERLSFLMERDYNQRKLYYKHIRSLYQLRNDIVHTAKSDITKKELKSLHIVVYNLLLLLINIHQKFESKKDFIDKLNEVKYGRTYTFQKKQIYIS